MVEELLVGTLIIYDFAFTIQSQSLYAAQINYEAFFFLAPPPGGTDSFVDFG